MTLPIDERSVALWRFDERFEALPPSDATGNLGDLEVGSGLTRPGVDLTYSNGVARTFTDTPARGYEIADTADDLLLARSLSILALMSFDVDGQDTAATPGTVVWRGRDTDETSFGLRISVDNASASLVRLQMIWEQGSTEIVDQGVLITWPANEEFLIAAIREVEGDGFAVRYVVNGQATNGNTGHAFDLGGTTGADVFIGCEPTGASAYTNHLVGSIAYLEIFGDALSVDEVEQVWLGYYIDAPRGIVAARGLLPPGAYSEDPASFIQREVAIEGAALGSMRNRGRRRREFPDAASGDKLAEWELLTAQTVRADDSIDQRQQRLVDFLQLDPGLATADLLAELLDALGYTDPADIEQLFYNVGHTQDFATATTPGADEALIIEGNAAFTVAASVLELDATAQDLSFDPVAHNSPSHLWSFTDSLDVFFGGKVTRNAAPTADDVLIGFQIGSLADRDWLFIGMIYDGADYGVNWIRFRNGGFDSGFTELVNPFNGADVFFRFRHRGEGAYDVQWGTSDALAQAQTPTVLTGPSDPLWAGFAAVANVSTGVSVDYGFDDWYSHEANGTQPTVYRLKRDPADAGAYDIGRAQDLLRTLGHAHYEGYVTDLDQLLCDTAGGCGREPLGI